jgi:carboxyl-terminal processing protease
MLKEEAWIAYLNLDDPAIEETLRVMREKKAFPETGKAAKNNRSQKAK